MVCPFENDGQQNHRLLTMNNYLEDLKRLEIDCILFNPLFQSHTHGYDTMDYKQVDVRLGTNEDLALVIDKLHQNGSKLFLMRYSIMSAADFLRFRM